MTAGVGIHGCLETLKAIPLVKERLGVKTILGISNVSHGMPERSKLNLLYFKLALTYGLDAAIVDVTDRGIKEGIGRRRREKEGEGREQLLEAFKAEVERQRRLGKPPEKKAKRSLRISGYPVIRISEKAVIEGDQEIGDRAGQTGASQETRSAERSLTRG